MKRISIVSGHFGSGKTEFSINLALYKKMCYNKIIIADLDTVNPYFRTNDAADFLKNEGIDLIASEYASTNVDIPALPGEVNRVFEDKSAGVVLDVGGDDEGATVLGRYNKYLKDEDYDMFMVINARRPLTSTPEDVIELMRNIEYTSRLKITALVNNTNLSYETTAEDVIYGQKLVDEVSRLTGLPVAYTSGREDVLNKITNISAEKKFPLNLVIDLPF